MAIKNYKARTEVGARINQLRTSLGWSIEQLADLCEMTPKQISRIEMGKYDVGIDVLATIAEAMGAKLTMVMVG